MEKIFKMFAALIALATMPPGERDEKELAKTLKGVEAELEKARAEGGDFGQVGKLIAVADQLRQDLDAQAEELRRIRRAGLEFQGGQTLGPRGRSERIEMLADGKCFMSDEAAKRFGGYMGGAIFRLYGRWNDCPTAMKEVHEAVLKDFEVGVDASGGYVIPDEFIADLIRNVEVEGRVFPLCRRIPLVTVGTVNIPKRTAGTTAYWIAPGAMGTRSTPTFDIVQLTPEKLMTLVAYPNEFNRSRLLIVLGNFIGMEIVYGTSYAIDNALVNGDGTASYGGITGILQSANITAVSAAAGHELMSEIDGTDVSDVIAGMTVEYGRDEARWGMSISVQGKLRALKDTNGNPLYLRGDVREPSTIDGYPYVISPRMPAASAITDAHIYGFYGDLRKSHIVGMLQDMSIGMSEHAAWESDMTVVRGIMHIDIQETDPNAVVTAKSAAA